MLGQTSYLRSSLSPRGKKLSNGLTLRTSSLVTSGSEADWRLEGRWEEIRERSVGCDDAGLLVKGPTGRPPARPDRVVDGREKATERGPHSTSSMASSHGSMAFMGAILLVSVR